MIRLRNWLRENQRRLEGFLLVVLFVVAVAIVVYDIYLAEMKGFKVIETLSQSLANFFPDAVREIVVILSAVITFILGHYLYDKFKEPKLAIIGVSPLHDPSGDYWRINVKNAGRKAAENCTGSIRLFGHYANGNTVDIRWSVCWSTTDNPRYNPRKITINVEEEQSLDVYRVTSPQPSIRQFQVPTETGWQFTTVDRTILISNFAPPANLQLEVRITAKNARKCEKTFSLKMQRNDVVLS